MTFLETSSFWSNVAVAALTGLAAIASMFALYFSIKVGAEKDSALDRFKAESAATISSADARAAEARKLAAEAGEGTAKALADVAAANERTKALELATEQQRERAAKAEKELLELKQRLAWRSLTPDQTKKLVAELSQFPGTQVSVTQLGEAEAALFAQQIINVLIAAKWSVGKTVAGIISPPPYAIICAHQAGDKAAEVFIRLLKKDFLVTERTGRSFSIVVGLKSPP